METCTEIQSRREEYLFKLYESYAVDTGSNYANYLKRAGNFHFVSSTFEGFTPYEFIISCW